ncbi:hypothetical protein NW762_012907 [Fusarium torreyae]|uniref:Uncharacterized protein n=1 Tax=Fusarium torreyae TaxID=1237075 RepID=A0A9W8V814_9HYPO|nr:hypothetical protein NW762_012907 [Fusarium torreyae]
MSEISPAERKALVDSQLSVLQVCINRALQTLDPTCQLSRQLHETSNEIRRHLLVTLMEEANDNSSAERHSNLASESCLNQDHVSLDGTSSRASCTDISQLSPGIKGTVDRTSKDNDTTMASGCDNILVTDQVIVDENSNHDITTKARVESVEPAKKRRAEDDNETQPVAKRIKTWLTQLTRG